MKAYNLRFIDRVDGGGNFYGSRNHGYSNGEWTLLNNESKERKLTNCDNGRDRRDGIKRDGEIKSRSYRSKGSI